MTDAEMIVQAVEGLGDNIDLLASGIGGQAELMTELLDKVELCNALLAGVILFLGFIAGIVFLRELWRSF